MKHSIINIVLAMLLVVVAPMGFAADGRPDVITPKPVPVGESGIAWYTTWHTAKAEAARSNRPIFFMSATATCNGVSGVF